MNINEYFEAHRLGGKASSVRYDNTTRLDKAKEQLELKTVSVDEIIKLTNRFLTSANIEPVPNPIVNNSYISKLTNNKFKVSDFYKKQDLDRIFYKNLMSKNNLSDERDIVWMKFAKDNEGNDRLVVVAKSNDINFIIPSNSADYTKKDKDGSWSFNTAGVLLHKLGMKYDESFILAFPLKSKDNQSMTTKENGSIETGIGNYLIDNKVPIIDFYSHNW
ncbi:hypothetical protein ACQW5G_04000 [Fructilactobacillus sp. Tb1]|uniref:hypothetical protein n=1 Tax=Fructilactobacillus sp. Tb1 TaxID=3422304 RepID=UPI003D2964D7